MEGGGGRREEGGGGRRGEEGGGGSGKNGVQTARLYLGGPALPPSTAGQCGSLLYIDSTALGRWNTNADQIGFKGRRGEERKGMAIAALDAGQIDLLWAWGAPQTS